MASATIDHTPHTIDMESPSIKRRKFEYPATHLPSSTPSSIALGNDGWHLLQPILENEVLCAKIPTSGMAFDLLVKWFQIIAGDQEKLRVFRQWIMPGSEDAYVPSKKVGLSFPVPLSEIKRDIDDPEDDHKRIRSPTASPISATPSSSISSTASSSTVKPNPSSSTSRVTSIDFITNETPITPRSTPQVLLLQQLLQQQQQQIVLLQKLQNNNAKDATNSANIPNTITLNPSTGSAGVVLTVSIKGGQWHPYSDTCNCTCGFTTMDGTVNTANRIPGGNEGAMCFVVPALPASTPESTSPVPLVVHLTPCNAPHSALVCANSFMYGRERPAVASSDEDSEDTPESSLCDDDGDDEDSGENPSPSAAPHSSPKQLMTIRERMMEFVGSGARGTARVVVVQQPPSRVVWKNRRLDVPFKVRVEAPGAEKLSVLALVVDHKGKLQIDAMENFEEDCGPQGAASFHNLRMTKGTWGKEWAITFVAVKNSTTNDPVVVGVSQPCAVVVKTRKNPQVRNINRGESPSPVFVERKSVTPNRLKRNRVEDLLDAPANSSPLHPSPSRPSSHTDALNNLLYAAEIKHQEREYQGRAQPPSLPVAPSLPPSASSSPIPPPRQSLMLPSIRDTGFGSPEPNFANLQSLLGFLEEVKIKHHPKLSIVEQPQLKREGNVLIVKKGKPFRTPFRLQMRTTPLPGQRADYAPTPDYNPQQYVCVAMLRNDKGEEVALKNSEVSFDARGLATFSGLMVMKGTWGKTVQLTFEARWGGAKRLAGGNNWPPLRMLVVAETPALQLMCYTKDKKLSNSG